MKWSLNVSNFTWLDRLKICKFFLNPSNFWTMNKYVQKYEKQMAEFVGFKYAVYVSSGSAANTILAMNLKDKLVKSGEFEKRNIVVLPSVTWQTSASPWIREGFKPFFIDVSLGNFGMDLNKLEEFLKINNEKVAVVFPTCLLGFNIFYAKLKKIRESFPKICFGVDQCENNFGTEAVDGDDYNYFTSTTSTYMGHELQSVEGGFIFTNNFDEYITCLMYRNHGMTRSLDGIESQEIELYKNKKVDSRFDFYCLGSNFRNSDIHAFIGLLDFKRRYRYVVKRKKLYNILTKNLNSNRYILPDYSYMINWHVPFCLPIICKGEDSKIRLQKIIAYCLNNDIETRPIVSGFLGYQTAYKGLMDEKDYPNSVFLHNNGIYIGLHPKLKKKQILKLVDYLNKI